MEPITYKYHCQMIGSRKLSVSVFNPLVCGRMWCWCLLSLSLVVWLPQVSSTECVRSEDCPSAAPYCSRWGYCQWTQKYGDQGPSGLQTDTAEVTNILIYLSRKLYSSSQSILVNISFYIQQMSKEQVEIICQSLDITVTT